VRGGKKEKGRANGRNGGTNMTDRNSYFSITAGCSAEIGKGKIGKERGTILLRVKSRGREGEETDRQTDRSELAGEAGSEGWSK
jgi:hypothetical protein